MKRKSWWCLLLVGLVTVVGCAKTDVSTEKSGLVYDVAAVSRILGLPCESSDPVPQAKDGEVVIYYGGWSLKQLRNSPAGKKWMGQVVELGEKDEWKSEPGYRRLLLPVPSSNRKGWSEQLRHLATIDTAWQPASVCVAATALLIHLTETGNNLLLEDSCIRCAEVLPTDCRVILMVDFGRVRGAVEPWPDRPFDRMWLAAAQKVP
ncbi:hypothetical protein HYW11_01025 [Candidatus Peregrinibacteria bacterium]|nr:hypothetical protein [Candidatus Peregrinibacteria bacterium]